MERSKFLDKFLADRPRLSKQTKSVVQHDRWDEATKDSLYEEVKEFAVSSDQLSEFTRTGEHAFGDMWYTLNKAMVRPKETEEIRPSYLINRAVMGQAIQLTEWEAVRTYCIGDPIGAAFACISMEPKLEVIFDKLKLEAQMASQLEEMLSKQEELIEEHVDLQNLMDEALEQDPNADLQEWQDQQARVEEYLEQTEQMIKDGETELTESLTGKADTINTILKPALNETADEMEQVTDIQRAWSMQPGQLQRMSPGERIELARRINTPRFKFMAEIIGPMQRLAMAEQMKKTKDQKEEVYDILLGNDLTRVLPIELGSLGVPALQPDFYRKYSEQSLLQFELQSEEKQAKGGIIFLEDGSGSMSGKPEIWAKGIGLCLLHIAKTQDRPFHGIHFGSRFEIKQFDFSDPKAVTIDQVIEFAETFFCGGTDFMTPLSIAMDKLVLEYEKDGAVKGDIVMVTDGVCDVHDKWFRDFKDMQEKIGFRVFGILIGSHAKYATLDKICDGRVVLASDLVTGNDVKQIFREV